MTLSEHVSFFSTIGGSAALYRYTQEHDQRWLDGVVVFAVLAFVCAPRLGLV